MSAFPFRLPASADQQSAFELDAQGRIKVDARCRTSVPGIFAAGDVTDVYAEQALVALGEGAKAALSAYEYLLPGLPTANAGAATAREPYDGAKVAG